MKSAESSNAEGLIYVTVYSALHTPVRTYGNPPSSTKYMACFIEAALAILSLFTLAYCAPHDFKYGPLIMSRDIIWPGMASFQTGLNRPMYIHYSHESGQTYVICSTERVFPKSGRPSYTRVLYLKESYMQDLWMPLCDSGLFAAARFVPVNSTLVKLPAPSWIKEQLMSLQVMLYENKDGMRDAICEEVEHEIWWEEENASTYESGHATGKKGSDSSSTAGKGSRRRAN